MDETDKNDQPSQVASDADAETANSSPEAPEVALSQQSQLGANNDTFTDKEDIENCNLSQNVHNASATANGNGKGIQMTSVQNRAVQLKVSFVIEICEIKLVHIFVFSIAAEKTTKKSCIQYDFAGNRQTH